jgi:hypothetical protein
MTYLFPLSFPVSTISGCLVCLSRSGFPGLPVRCCLSRSVLFVLFYMSCSACPVLDVLFLIVPFWMSCSACSVMPVPLCLSCCACPFCLSRSACPVLPVVSASLALHVLFCHSRFGCHVLPVLCWSPALDIMFCLSCSGFPVQAFLPLLRTVYVDARVRSNLGVRKHEREKKGAWKY